MSQENKKIAYSLSIEFKGDKTSLEELINLLQSNLDSLKKEYPEASAIVVDGVNNDYDDSSCEIDIIVYRPETEEEANERLETERLNKQRIISERKRMMQDHLKAYEHWKKLAEEDDD